MRVLLVQANEAEASCNMAVFETATLVADRVADAAEAFEYMREYEYDIVVLDRVLPDMEGCLVIRRMRARKIETPVLLLSNAGTGGLTVAALNAGADDVLARPFKNDELVARIESIIRRANGHVQSRLEIGPMLIDMASHEVLIGGEKLLATRKEYAVLELLALRRGNVLTKQKILSCLYDGLDSPETDIVSVYICTLRKKMAAHHAEHLIETVTGHGYVIRDDRAFAIPGKTMIATAVHAMAA